MASNFNRIDSSDTNVHFSKALMGEVESSRMVSSPIHLTTFNAGDIVPIYCREILPNESLSIDLDFVIRQTTLLTPTMGNMHVDFFAFFVPNRIVNQSWKAVEGENLSGSWTANSVSLATLKTNSSGTTQIPVGSVADYYGFPTQQPMPNSLLSKCHDLKFRGYVMIYNEHFRDQNYQPPLPLSTLNIYQGFLDPASSSIPFSGTNILGNIDTQMSPSVVSDGSFGAGAIAEAVVGSGKWGGTNTLTNRQAINSFRAINPPLKANKLHDYFTSVLPSPQKSNSSIFAPVSGQIGSVPVVTSPTVLNTSSTTPLRFGGIPSGLSSGQVYPLFVRPDTGSDPVVGDMLVGTTGSSETNNFVYPTNLVTDNSFAIEGLGLSVDDIRMASAIQQVYEVLARGGSRYRELVSSFFGIEADDPYSDIPKCLGKISRDLDLYQTAQTSASESGSTAQGNLAAFGYTSSGGHLFSSTFLEHGYVHILAVVRHKNIYPSYFARDNFRLNMLDFYLPQLANISEQPIFAREINPFSSSPDDAFGYQEAWAEYRFEPDMVTGQMRPMPDGTESLSLWNYADSFDSSLQIADGNWLKSNSQQVLDRTLAVTSSLSPQLKGQFKFKVDKVLPMPTYSVPGMDII